MPRLLFSLFVSLVWCVAGCQPPVPPPESTPPIEDPVTDREGPTLNTVPITVPQPAEMPIRFSATVTDPSDVYGVYLHFKPSNTSWQSLLMTPSGEPAAYELELPPTAFDGASSISYYLVAADATPYRNTTQIPSAGAEEPYRFNLSVDF
ncbi:MAG: hypothetical protein ACKO6N_01125 [Myxococcota bacterium]